MHTQSTTASAALVQPGIAALVAENERKLALAIEQSKISLALAAVLSGRTIDKAIA